MIVIDTYNVIVQAPDREPDQARPWHVRAFRAGQDEAIARSDHFDIEHACADVFHAIRMDIGRRLDRGVQAGICDAVHNGDGFDAHHDATNFEGLSDEQTAGLLVRLDELLAEHPQVLAHSQRNMAGEFSFSPATCPLCEQLAALEVRAHAYAVGAADGATA